MVINPIDFHLFIEQEIVSSFCLLNHCSAAVAACFFPSFLDA